jgi:hypothetical protein
MTKIQIATETTCAFKMQKNMEIVDFISMVLIQYANL